MKRVTAASCVSMAIVGFLVAAATWAFVQVETAADPSQAAAEWLASLDDEQRAKSQLPFDTPQRVDWHFIPKSERKGLQIKEMTEPQRERATALLRSCLSQVGFDKARTIMALEHLLKALESGRTGTPLRDPERYYFTVFGEPSSDGRWGLSVEGHHLSLNFVIEGDKFVSTTPTVFCANPALVMAESDTPIEKGTRVLADEELLAFELLKSLTDEQRTKAVIAEEAPREIRAAGEPHPPQEEPVGIPASSLNREQRNLLRRLVSVYADNMPEDVARARMQAIREAGPDNVHFAWAGADRPGIGHYYRIQGPTFLIEFVNRQPDSAGNPANHIHSIWRDMRGDFALAVKKAE